MLSLHHAQVTLEKQKVEAAFRDSSQLLTRLEVLIGVCSPWPSYKVCRD